MVADKVLCDIAFNFAADPKYDGYQRGLASMVYNFFDKNASGSGIKNENIPNKELTKELQKLVTDIYSKYAWVVPIKDKKELQLLMLFKKF